jgi:hypothetical protein
MTESFNKMTESFNNMTQPNDQMPVLIWKEPDNFKKIAMTFGKMTLTCNQTEENNYYKCLTKYIVLSSSFKDFV